MYIAAIVILGTLLLVAILKDALDYLREPHLGSGGGGGGGGTRRMRCMAVSQSESPLQLLMRILPSQACMASTLPDLADNLGLDNLMALSCSLLEESA